MATYLIPKGIPPVIQPHLLPIIPQYFQKLSYDDLLILPLFFLDPFDCKWFERPQQTTRTRLVTTPGQTRNISKKLDETGSDVAILWGSQSGTAEGFAHRLAIAFRQRFRVDAQVMDLSDYDPHTIALLPETEIVVFIMSTCGEGDPCDNSWDFVNWLKKPFDLDFPLKNLRYAAFGLGNSEYRFFNKVITDVVELLDSLGAAPVLPVGRGDEAKRSTEEDFVEWKDKFLDVVACKLQLTEHETEYKPTVEVVESDNPRSGVCLSTHPQIKYKTGDHIAIWPVNPDEEVSNLLRLLGLEFRKDATIIIRSPGEDNDKLTVPTQTTISTLLGHYLDICAPVKRETVLALAQFATTDKAKSFLKALGKNKCVYGAFLAHNHLTFSRLLQRILDHDNDALWSCLPLSFVIETIPQMTPRTYSISSSSIMSPRNASITVAVAPTPLSSNTAITIPGLTSTYLSSLRASTSSSESVSAPLEAAASLYAQVLPSTFKPPVLSKTPLIMVAAGTGIAPFRGFLYDRARLASTGKPIGRMLLFFGCRHPDVDYLYQDELQNLHSGPLKDKLELVTAFEREEERKYVQDKLEEKGGEVMRLLLEEDAAFYVCGSVSMAKGVERVVAENVGKRRGWDEKEVEAWRRERRRAKRWHEDVWG
ncbi:hypothetical protein K469DRAFT_689852 [Zopfia rhizophila CBS 207.26]|uniref:NADPH--cytochrome P450 reductase n=1 Tax=Zopfia rhizophila CBS 207.26 TaxID=1314779 RepID=A0A6A6E0L0_9PEZI|nr:hypothetical protein K469DRAFT_689852 [Zopfia rhizophila CBS 207.26]